MDAKALLQGPRTLHRAFTQRVAGPVPENDSPRFPLPAQAIWLGLFGAWLETSVILLHRWTIGTTTRTTVRLNWYHISMSVPAHLALMAVWLLLARAILACRPSFRSGPAIAGLGWFVALVSPLLAIEELDPRAAVVLALGLARLIAPRWQRFGPALVRRSLAAVAIVSVVVAAGSFAWVHSAERRAAAALPAPPTGTANVLLIVMDTVRADHLSLHGYQRPTSPTLEAIARRGVVFDFARAPAPWTLPSHAAMFTGRWPHELSVDTDQPLDREAVTLAEILSRHGYACGGFAGNSFYCNAWFGLDQGFSRYQAAPENQVISVQETLRCAALGRRLTPLWSDGADKTINRSAAEINRAALAWLDENPERPFFLFLNYFDAHAPYTVPAGAPLRFSQATRKQVFEASRAAFEARERAAGLATPERRTADERLASLAPGAYDDCIRYVDEQIARLLDELERRGRRRDTWIIVTADHGEHFGEHDQFWHGSSLYRPVVDVPLLIIPPGGTTPRRIATPVSPRDIPATLADVLALSEPRPFPGHSLRRFWDDRQPGPVPPAEPPLSVLKLARDAPGYDALKPHETFRVAAAVADSIYHSNPLGGEELYDASDRAEADNLATEPASADLLMRLRNWIQALREGA